MRILEIVKKQIAETLELRDNHIKIYEVMKFLNSIDKLTPEQIKNFFGWYTNERKFFMFFDEQTEGVIVNRHRLMSHIETAPLMDGEYELSFMVMDDANSDRRIKYVIILNENAIKVYRYDTCTNFKREYTAKLFRYKLLTPRSTPELFNTIKDFMWYCIKMRSMWCLELKEDIHETVPLHYFAE
jgi:hypothetical protein